MELVEAGYKVTEVGRIPDDWNYCEIGQYIDLLTGFPFPSRKYAKSGVRLLKGSNVKRGQTDWSENITNFWDDDLPKYRDFVLKDGDLVIAMDGSLVGRSYAQISKKDLPALLLQRVARLRSSKISISYLRFFVGSEWFIKYSDSVKTVTAIPHISPKDIRQFKIPLPPTLAEQKAIATALSDVDDLISSLDSLIEKKKMIKQGAMQELLTPNKNSNIVKLGKYSEMSSGGTPSSKVEEYYNGDIIWISISDITESGKYIDSSSKKITMKGLENSSAKLFPVGTVFLAMYASIGKCCIITSEASTSQAILGITPKTQLSNEYLSLIHI